jgi:ATP synthase F0 subunit b
VRAGLRLGIGLVFGLTLGAGASALAEEPAAGEARAAEGEGGEEGISNWWSWDYGPSAKEPANRHLPPPFGFALINFALFAGVMYRLAAKPLRTFVADRHLAIRRDLDEAAKLHAAAAAKLGEYERKVAGIDAEVDALLAGIRKEAESEKARIIAAAEEQARRLKGDAERQIAAEIDRARREMRRDVVERALASAEEILRKQVGADDQRKMADRYVADLEQNVAARQKRPS